MNQRMLIVAGSCIAVALALLVPLPEGLSEEARRAAVIGLIVTVVYGPTSLNALANNKWLNLFFAALFLLFGLMLLGLFELQLPSWLLTWTSKREATAASCGN